MSSAISTGGAFDDMFTAGSGRFVGADGQFEHLAVRQWAGDTNEADRHLFTERCSGRTIDIGCGPGRLVGDLVARGVPALGIDVSAEAVRQTRVRGALALRLDVFDDVPWSGRWDHALLADGNIGIGGHPVRLLARIRELLGPGGTVLAEVSPDGVGVVRDTRRLWVEGQYSPPFGWALVGADAVEDVARDAGLAVRELRSFDGRQVATLVADERLRLSDAT